MSGRKGVSEGAVLQIHTENRDRQSHCRWPVIKPSFVWLILIIFGLIIVTPVCAVASAPVASFVSNVTKGTIPLDVQYIDSSTNTPTSWFWSFGDGGTSTLQNPVYSYETAGTYTVILAATNAAGTDTETKGGYINADKAASAPLAAFVSNVTGGTVPFGVQFVDLSTNSPALWVWSFGDGTTSSLQNPVHTYSTAGTYTVTLTATNEGGSSTVTKAEYLVAGNVAMIPVASFVSSVTSGSSPLTVQFVDSTANSPTSWIWSFGDGNMSTLQNPSHTYTTSDTYTVTLIATNAAGSDTDSKADYITVTYATPVANFTSDVTSGSSPLTVQFTDVSANTPTSWSWKFGDGGKSTDQHPAHEYTDAGTYTVSLTAKNSAGSDTAKMTGYITVTSTSSPVASFIANMTSGMVPFTVRFSDTSSNTPTSWLWSFGDGSSSTEENPTYTYTAAGSYTVSLTASNGAGNDSRTAGNYITAYSVNPHTPVTTMLASEKTTAEPMMTVTDPAAVIIAETTVPAAASPTFIYVIAGIIAIGVVGLGAVLYFRRPPRGGHRAGDSRL
jgi:PKD repeat protein